MMKYIALLLSFPAFGAVTSVTESPATYQLKRGTSIIATPTTLAECETVKATRIAAEGLTRTTGTATYSCVTTTRSVVAFGVATPPPPPVTETWTRCAVEYQLCAFTGTRRVRYGAGTTWVVRELAAVNGGVMCGNGVFGDPAFGVEKVCEITGSYTPPPPPATGSATVSWNAVTRNTDNSSATITGYTVHYGTTSLNQSAQVPATATTYTINGLPSGTWLFSVSARSVAGVSDIPPAVAKVIP